MNTSIKFCFSRFMAGN
ncbi:peptide IlvX [Enterobacter cloacae]